MIRNEKTLGRIALIAIGAAILIAIIATFWPQFTHAAEAIVTPGGAAVVPEGTNIVIPWGAWLSELASTISAIVFAAIVWLLRRLPSQLVAVLQTMRAEQLLQRAVDYAANATAGAVKDEVMNVHVANDFVAKAVAYVVTNGAPKIVEWLGGKGGIGEKIIARIDVEENAAVIDVTTPDKLPVLRKVPAPTGIPPRTTVR